MIIKKNQNYERNLVRELISLPCETEWVEFKHNMCDPQQIGEYISALANSTALIIRPKAYMIWGVDDATHKIIGTSFNFRTCRKGSEELELWLSRMLSPSVAFRFFDVEVDDVRVVLLEIPAADRQPVKFSGEEFIRIGSNKKKLKEYPERERALWRAFDTTPHELRNAKENISPDYILKSFDIAGYYEKMGFALPENKNKVIDDFSNEKFIRKNDHGGFSITNLGALLIAKDLRSFDELGHKLVRVIWYKENNRLETIREKVFNGGYAISYDEIVEYILTIIPQEEVIEDSIRKSVLAYPEIAIRELTANMIIHQAIDQRGTNPMIEVFKNRIEFSNVGSPLVPVERIVDTVPVSRNENLAGFMHKCGICEERGSGYDKVIDATGKRAMLAPKIEIQNDRFTKVTLYSKIPLDLTSKEDRIRTCYMQACYAYVNGEAITNNNIRNLFDIDSADKYKASRIIKESLEAGVIKPIQPNMAPRHRKYIPIWA